MTMTKPDHDDDEPNPSNRRIMADREADRYERHQRSEQP